MMTTITTMTMPLKTTGKKRGALERRNSMRMTTGPQLPRRPSAAVAAAERAAAAAEQPAPASAAETL